MAASDVTDISAHSPQRGRSSFRRYSRSGESRLTQSASASTLRGSDLLLMAWACPFGAARAPRAGARRSGGFHLAASRQPASFDERCVRPQLVAPQVARHSLATDFLFLGWAKGKMWFLEIAGVPTTTVDRSLSDRCYCSDTMSHRR
jgi:hypothetical protein